MAERWGLPVAETSAGKGSLTGPACVGGIGVNGTGAANELAAAADVVLCVGTRLSDFTTASRSLFAAPDVRFVAINVDSADAHALGALPVLADARAALEALAADPRAILSRHGDPCRAGALTDSYRRLASRGSGPLKLVPRAERVEELAAVREVLARAARDGRTLTCFASGAAGRASRVLAPSWGSWATYGSVEPGRETANTPSARRRAGGDLRWHRPLHES